MDSRFSLPACLVLLCGLTGLGPATAEAAGHEKYSARYSGRKYGDQIAQMSAT
jgi:hypothetical protein